MRNVSAWFDLAKRATEALEAIARVLENGSYEAKDGSRSLSVTVESVGSVGGIVAVENDP